MSGWAIIGMRRRRGWPILSAAVLLLAGCAGAAPSGTSSGMAVMGPPPGKAMVVFLRPALLDKAASSPVLDISAEPPALVGVLTAGRKFVYVSDPGARRFMVMGESAGFMDADLRAGHIYYARVSPRRSISGERFSLRPVRASDIALASELTDCSWGDPPAMPQQWVDEHRAGIEKKKTADLPAWLASPHAVLDMDSP
jgi:hypothetical protein